MTVARTLARSLVGRSVGGPDGFRRLLIRLGPTYIKVGQYLALRPDLLSQEYCDALMELFDRVPPFPWEQAREILTSELGPDRMRVFAEIDPRPIGAGSLAQTHLAKLADGTPVALKVQRPHARTRVLRDLSRARVLARLLELSGAATIVSPTEIVDELSGWLLQELDFTHELANVTLLRRLAADSTVEYIPRTYPELSSRRVVTLEYVRGISFGEVLQARRGPSVDGGASTPALDVDRTELAANLLTATLRQIFRYQFFHADLHPGNLFVMPDGAIGYVDFGLCEAWDGSMRDRLFRYLAAVYSGDVEQMYWALTKILVTTERTDLDAFRTEFFNESRRWISRMRTSGESRMPTFREFDGSPIAQWMIAVMRVARQNGLRVPTRILGIYRALLVAETVAYELKADADLRTVGRQFFEQLQVDEVRKALEPGQLQPTVLSLFGLARDSPGQVQQILSELADGSFALNVYSVEPPKVARALNRRARLIATAILSVGVAVLLGRPDLPDVGSVPLAWPLIGLLGLLYAAFIRQWRGMR